MSTIKQIPFNSPAIVGNEAAYVEQAIRAHKLSGDGPFNKKCSQWFKDYFNAPYATLTPSCTAALEMAYLLIDLKPGDEVILPSFTFTSTATAITLFGATPVFVDVDKSLNIDLSKITAAITPRTKAICPVHYAGTSCEMDELRVIADKHKVYIIEDAAQGLGAEYKGKKLAGIGDIAAISFHETKNIVCGEGGALIINNPALVERAEIIKDKGTNRQRFLRGQVDKYTWQDKGSSYLLGELPAAYLLAQLEKVQEVNNKRLNLWKRYHEQLASLAQEGKIELQQVPGYSNHNAHIFYILLPTEEIRHKLSTYLKERAVIAVPHYVPLHSAPAGQRMGRTSGSMANTDGMANRLLRLPLFYDLEFSDVDFITSQIREFFKAQ